MAVMKRLRRQRRDIVFADFQHVDWGKAFEHTQKLEDALRIEIQKFLSRSPVWISRVKWARCIPAFDITLWRKVNGVANGRRDVISGPQSTLCYARVSNAELDEAVVAMEAIIKPFADQNMKLIRVLPTPIRSQTMLGSPLDSHIVFRIDIADYSAFLPESLTKATRVNGTKR
jgi:hypothetical protein